MARERAEWLGLLRVAPVVTRESVTAPREVKNLFHTLVAGYVRVGWLDRPSVRECLICLEPAQVWHHPSYRKGRHAIVQPLCVSCHIKTHRLCWSYLMRNGLEPWTCAVPTNRPEVEAEVVAFRRKL